MQFFGNLVYNASGKIGLSEDEAYQWVWSKHLALSYYSKPLLIAVTQFLGTTLFGDTVFGVRFFSPVIAAIMGAVLLRFMARVLNARAAFWLSVILPTVPMVAAGSILMTIDPLSVMFWTLAMLAGWRAVQENCHHLRLAVGGMVDGAGIFEQIHRLVSTVVVGRVFCVVAAGAQATAASRTVARAAGQRALCPAGADLERPDTTGSPCGTWRKTVIWTRPGLSPPANLWHGFEQYTVEFLGSELGLINPFYFLAVIWAAVMFWRRQRGRPLPVYFFSMGAPLFLCYLLFSLHSRVFANWIAPSVVPLLCLGVVYWDGQWQKGLRAAKFWLVGGLVLGALATVLMHDNDLVHSIAEAAGKPLPPKADALRRVEGWPETVQVVRGGAAETAGGRQTGFHHRRALWHHRGNQLSSAGSEGANPRPSAGLLPQFEKRRRTSFISGRVMRTAKGQNAIYVEIMDGESGPANPPPEELMREFESVKSLGEFTITHHGRFVRRIQISECRNLR